MSLTSIQWRSFLARSMYKFFIDGALKSCGVLLEATARDITKYHFIAGWLFTLQIGACYLGSPVVGVIQGRISHPLLAFLGGLSVGLGNVILALMTSSASTCQMLFLLAISGVGFGLLNIVTVLSLKDAFGQSFALAFSTTVLASNVGIAVMPLLLESLLRNFAKQDAMLIFSSVYCTLLLLGLITPSRNSREEEDERSPSETPQGIRNKKLKSNDTQEREELLPVLEGGVSSRSEGRDCANKDKANGLISLLKSHPYVVFLLFLSTFYDYIFSSWSIFLVPLGESFGLKSKTAVWLSTLSGLAGFVGRLFCIAMYLWSDINLHTGFTIPYLLIACGCLLAVFLQRFLWLAVAASLGGFGVAVLGNVASTVIPACVCEKHFQVTVILLYTTSGVAVQFGGIATGGIIDVTGSYRIAFTVMAGICLLQVFLSLWWSCTSFSTKARPPECKP